MSLTECSLPTAGSSVCRQSSNAGDRLLAGVFSPPALAGLSCSMDVSKLLAALTAPLLTSPVSTRASRTDADGGYESSIRDSRSGVFMDGHTKNFRKIIEGLGNTEGCKPRQEKPEQVAATLAQSRPVSYAAEEGVAAVADDDNREAFHISRKQDIADDYTAACHDAAQSRRRAGVSVDRLPATNESDLQNGLSCEQRVGDAANIIAAVTRSTTVQHYSRRLSETEAVVVPSIAQRPTESAIERHGRRGSKTEPEAHGESVLGHVLDDTFLQALPSSPLPLTPLQEVASARETVALGKGEAANENSAPLGRESGFPGGNAHTPQVQNALHHKNVSAQTVEREQQMLSPRDSEATCTADEMLHVKRPNKLQSPLIEGGAEDAQKKLTMSGRQYETQQDRLPTHRQSADAAKGGWSGGQQQTGMQGSYTSRARGSARRRVSGESLDGIGGRTEHSDGAGKQEIACTLPPLLHQEDQLLRETLELLQKAGYPNENSTSGVSTRTSLAEAAEGDVGSEDSHNGPKMSQGLQHGTLKELRRQLLQHISSKEDLEGRMDDELKRCVTRVLAAALGGKEVNSEGDACTISYPLSPSSLQTGTECLPSTSSETAASSLSQSPLEVPKEEAPEGARCDSTAAARSRSTSSGLNGSNESSDRLLTIQQSSAPDTTSNSPIGSTGTSNSTSRAADGSNAICPSASASDSSVAGRRSCSTLGTSDVSDSSARRSGSVPCPSTGPNNSSVPAAGGVRDSNPPDDSKNACNRDTESGKDKISDTPCKTNVSFGSNSSSDAKKSGAHACPGNSSKNNNVSCRDGSVPHDIGSSGATWTPAVVGEAVLKDCLRSVIDLEQHAVRVLMLPPPDAGAAKQNALPSLLLQKTTAGSRGQLADVGLWGTKMEKDVLGTGGTSEQAMFSTASCLGIYPSVLGDAAAAGFRKDAAGPLLVPSVPDANVPGNFPESHTYTLLQQQLAGNQLSAGVGGILGSKAVTLGEAVASGTSGTGTAAGTLDQSLSQMWLLQQRGSSLAPPLATAAPCPFQLPTTLPTSLPWMQPGTTSNIGATASVARPSTASAVAAAALLPRSFRSRSDYLSLCNLQGCATSHENERKPRKVEELRQLPAEEHISLQEMHLLAEHLVREFMRLDRTSRNLSAGSKLSKRTGHRGSAVGSTKLEGDALTGMPASESMQRAEPLVLHYRRDNLSFSVTPASAFTPYPPSVFEDVKVEALQKDAGAVRAGARSHTDMDEMEEEKRETLLGGRFFTSSNFRLNSGSSPSSTDKPGARGGSASQRQSKANVAASARTLVATPDDADDFVSPQATTHFFRARCQQAGTEVGISDSTTGAVDRAFAEATASYLRVMQRQNEHFSFCTEGTKQIVARDEDNGQQPNSRNGKTPGEELRMNGAKAGAIAHSNRGVDTATRSHQRLVASNRNRADWCPTRMK